MGFFGKLFGPRTVAEEPIDMRLLRAIHQQLIASGVPAVAGVTVEGQHLMTQDRRLAITVNIVEAAEGKLHAHVTSWRPNQAAAAKADPLEACVLGYGPGPAAIEQAANVWVRLVAAPLFSCMTGQVVLDADHFTGEEPWGVPGGHGCVGPFMVRGNAAGLDLDGTF